MARVLKQAKKSLIKEQDILTRTLILFAVIILVGGVWGWWHQIYSNPKRVFWGAIGHALQTRSYTRQSVQNDNGQIYIQNVYGTVSPKQIVSGTNQIKQDGAGGYDVITDVIGTPTTDFVRYVSVKTDQKSKDGKPLDYKASLGVWGKSEATDKQTNGQVYNQSALGVVPFGNLNLVQRNELIGLMQSKVSYKTEYSSASRKLVNGRPTYQYDVTVNAEAYITVLKKYAQMVGLTQLAQTNAEDFRTTTPLQFKFTIDVWTKQITKIEYDTGRTESYGSFGAQKQHIPTPSSTINIDELQQRVQSVQ